MDPSVSSSFAVVPHKDWFPIVLKLLFVPKAAHLKTVRLSFCFWCLSVNSTFLNLADKAARRIRRPVDPVSTTKFRTVSHMLSVHIFAETHRRPSSHPLLSSHLKPGTHFFGPKTTLTLSGGRLDETEGTEAHPVRQLKNRRFRIAKNVVLSIRITVFIN